MYCSIDACFEGRQEWLLFQVKVTTRCLREWLELKTLLGFKDGLRYKNIVSSQYIADAQIEFVSKGSLNDAQRIFGIKKLLQFLTF